MSRTKNLVLIALFAALVAIGAFIRIPMPLVPITLQFAFCLLAGEMLGVKGGTAVLIYVIMGLIGLPVFTEGGGIMYVLKPSFGYLIGMFTGTYLCGFISTLKPKNYWLKLIGALAAMLVVDAIGAAYMYVIYNYYLNITLPVKELMVSAVAVFLPTDVTWCVLVSLIAYKTEDARYRINR